MSIWFHGDTAKRTRFDDQHMDRDRTKDRNAQGPGIYWTSDKKEAKGYAYPKGYIYTAEIKSVKFIHDRKPKVDPKKVEWLIEHSYDPDGFLANWGFDPGHMSRERAMTDALRNYAYPGYSLSDAALMLYNDCYGRERANQFTRNMVRMGVNAFLHKESAVKHLIVYNPKIIKVRRIEAYSEVVDEAIDAVLAGVSVKVCLDQF
jgi:hypothetical protein